MTNDLETLEDFARCSREPEKIKHYIRCADKLLMDGVLHDDFFAILKEWGFSDKDVESLKSVMEVFPNHSLNTMQMEWLEEYRSSIVTPDRKKYLANFLSMNGISDINDIIAKIDGIKNTRDISFIFNKTDRLKQSEIRLKEFCDVVIKYLGKEGKRGWNYNNIKVFCHKLP